MNFLVSVFTDRLLAAAPWIRATSTDDNSRRWPGLRPQGLISPMHTRISRKVGRQPWEVVCRISLFLPVTDALLQPIDCLLRDNTIGLNEIALRCDKIILTKWGFSSFFRSTLSHREVENAFAKGSPDEGISPDPPLLLSLYPTPDRLQPFGSNHYPRCEPGLHPGQPAAHLNSSPDPASDPGDHQCSFDRDAPTQSDGNPKTNRNKYGHRSHGDTSDTKIAHRGSDKFTQRHRSRGHCSFNNRRSAHNLRETNPGR